MASRLVLKAFREERALGLARSAVGDADTGRSLRSRRSRRGIGSFFGELGFGI
jgi:hypothetical protein